MILAPVKAIFNLDTYIKATKQSVLKTLLFLLYLLVISSVLFFGALIIKTPNLDPILKNFTTQMAEVMPDIEAKDGVITANNGAYYEIAPEGLEQKIVFDTSRTEPVYPTQMQQEGIFALITDKKIYLFQQDGMQTYEVSKDLNFTLNKDYILNNQTKIIKNIKKFLFFIFAFAMPLVVIIIMAILMILAIIATAISQLFVKANVSFGDVFKISCYMLAPALFVLFITLLLPFNVPLIWLICFIVFMIYSQLILSRIKLQ